MARLLPVWTRWAARLCSQAARPLRPWPSAMASSQPYSRTRMSPPPPPRNVSVMFPGQGSQHPGMARQTFEGSPAARELIARANRAIGFDLAELMFEGDEETLTLTENAQPAVLVHSMAVLAALKEQGIDVLRQARVTMGHSLGEFTALTAAGVLHFEDAVRLVRARGKFMQDAVPVDEGGMVALFPISAEQTAILLRHVTDVTNGAIIDIANINSGEQVVASGAHQAIDLLAATKSWPADIATQLPRRMRATRLRVSAPFHSRLMQPAAREFAQYIKIEGITFHQPRLPIVMNVTGTEDTDPTTFPSLLVDQMTAVVQWYQSMIFAQRVGCQHFVELGGNGTLTALAQRAIKDRADDDVVLGIPEIDSDIRTSEATRAFATLYKS